MLGGVCFCVALVCVCVCVCVCVAVAVEMTGVPYGCLQTLICKYTWGIRSVARLKSIH